VRIAVVAGPDPGHTFPCLALARALARRGHEVVFATGAGHRSLVEHEGVVPVELPALAPSADDAEFGHRLWGRPVEMAPPLADVLGPHRPELVVSDVLTRAGAFAAELLGRPWIEVSPHHLMDPDPDVPPVGLGRRPARTPWRRADDARIRRDQAASVALGREQERAARRALGLPDRGGAALGRLLATLPGLEYPRRAWPADAHVVGALDYDPPWPPLEPPPGDARLVVVTDSTASSNDASLAEVALAGLARARVRVVATSGRELAAPANAVVGRGPHGPLLDEAAVAVSIGGHGFVTKALTRGVPLVVVPWEGDQRETAGRLRHTRAGMWLPPWALRPVTLRLAVARVLADPRFRRAAARLAAGARGLGPDHAAGVVERLAAGGVG
jgi:UDP:flavonoid glycosyltransferase YjiC (YdhE family)